MPPRSAKSRSRPRIQRMPSGSRPLAGSSRISTSGSPSSACASPSRWRMPSEYWRTRLRAALLSSPTSVEQLVHARAASHAHHLRARRRAPRGRGGRGAGRSRRAARRRAGPGSASVAVVGGSSTAEPPASGVGEPDQHPHRRGLAGAVGSEEPGHRAGLAAERDVADHGAPAEALRESCRFDHGGQHRASRPLANIGRRSIAGIDFGRGSRRAVRAYAGAAMTTRRGMLPGALLRGAGRQAHGARLDRRRDDAPARARRSARSRSAPPRTSTPTTCVVRRPRDRRDRAGSRCGGGAAARSRSRCSRSRSSAFSASRPAPALIALFNVALRGVAARDRDLRPRSRLVGGAIYSLVYPDPTSCRSRSRSLLVGADPGCSSSRGACSRARSATCCAARTSARGGWRPSSARTSSRRARPSGGGSRARCTTCSRTGSRC